MNLHEIIQAAQSAIWIVLAAWLVILLKRARWSALTSVPPVFLDGALWVVIAMGQAAQGELGSGSSASSRPNGR